MSPKDAFVKKLSFTHLSRAMSGWAEVGEETVPRLLLLGGQIMFHSDPVTPGGMVSGISATGGTNEEFPSDLQSTNAVCVKILHNFANFRFSI